MKLDTSEVHEQRIAELRRRVMAAQSDLEEAAETGSRMAATALRAMRNVEQWIDELWESKEEET